MHGILTIAAMHHRYVTSDAVATSSVELYHWQKTSSLLNQKLAHPIESEDADAIFATTTLLNGISFASIETDHYLDAWPLEPKPNDLQWLRLQEGIKLMIYAAKPWRKGSIFEELFHENDDNISTSTDFQPALAGIPARFIDLCDLSVTSHADNNPYHAAIQMLCPLFSIACTAETVMVHLNFIGFMRAEFLELLKQKDARALLILGYWYGLVCHCDMWWLTRRALLECAAICTYLDNHEDLRIRRLLEFPRQACGYYRTRQQNDLNAQPLVPGACVTM